MRGHPSFPGICASAWRPARKVGAGEASATSRICIDINRVPANARLGPPRRFGNRSVRHESSQLKSNQSIRNSILVDRAALQTKCQMLNLLRWVLFRFARICRRVVVASFDQTVSYANIVFGAMSFCFLTSAAGLIARLQSFEKQCSSQLPSSDFAAMGGLQIRAAVWFPAQGDRRLIDWQSPGSKATGSQPFRLFKIVRLIVASLASNYLKGFGLIEGLSCRARPAGV